MEKKQQHDLQEAIRDDKEEEEDWPDAYQKQHVLIEKLSRSMIRYGQSQSRWEELMWATAAPLVIIPGVKRKRKQRTSKTWGADDVILAGPSGMTTKVAPFLSPCFSGYKQTELMRCRHPLFSCFFLSLRRWQNISDFIYLEEGSHSRWLAGCFNGSDDWISVAC